MQKSLYTKYNEIFLSMLRDTRHAHRLRQADLADLLGLAQATVSKVERGERRLDVTELRVWLAALGVDFLGFMGQLDDRLRTSVVATEPRFSRQTSGRADSNSAGRSHPAPSSAQSRRRGSRN